MKKSHLQNKGLEGKIKKEDGGRVDTGFQLITAHKCLAAVSTLLKENNNTHTIYRTQMY
jgi:hypothetical protein